MTKFRSIVLLLLGCIFAPSLVLGQHTQYVNPFVGTGGHGHTYPGACVPFGMVQLSPDTRLEGWDGCSAYHYSDDTIYGFSHTHLSGTGCSDYGDILLMPVDHEVVLSNYNWKSHFSHDSESARPGYYKVTLNDQKVTAELTATARTGFHRYTFTNKETPAVVVDLKHRDQVLSSWIKLLNDSTIVGYRQSKTWAADQRVYFVAIFSKPIKEMLISKDEKTASKSKGAKGKNIKALLRFDPIATGQLLVKVALSAVSTDNALLNLRTEIPGNDFDAVANSADACWEKELSKIDVQGNSVTLQTNFYTALYHAFLQPNIYNDVNGAYRGRDMKVHQTNGSDYYTVFSLWDTYRATHPLYTLVQQKRTADFINTFIAQYEQGKLLPVWELSSNETYCMIGYHAVSVISDAYVKGIQGFDAEKALAAMQHSAQQNHHGLDAYKKQGYISSADASESVSKTLEYAYDDWCIAQMAQLMEKYGDYSTYIQRAQSYKNLYDPSTGFMRARNNGGWFKPFDPSEVNFNYTEANAWQYSFYVPQDIQGWTKLMGGQARLAEFLDALFGASSKTSGRDQADISGLIGQYAHGNEPSHHMAYLYNYAAQPWKTQAMVHRLQNEMYRNAPDGLCGNEDCGQMSSWLVLSSMGFYPVTPGSEAYMIGTPMFDNAVLHLENGKEFVIETENLTEENFYIQSATLNGQPFDRCYINHSEIMNGGSIHFNMGPKPNTSWGLMQMEAFPSAIKDELISPAPFVIEGSYIFNDSTTLQLSHSDPNAIIRYTLNGGVPDATSAVYKTPVTITTTTKLQMTATLPGCKEGKVVTAEFTKIDSRRQLKIAYPYAPQYAAGGNNALIDYIYGGDDFRTGAWQGYEGIDLNAVLDLGEVQGVSAVSIRFLQDMRSWIFMPLDVEILLSADGKTYKSIGAIKTNTPKVKSEVVIEIFKQKTKPTQARYVKIIARNLGTCPDWHPGAGGKCWIFADEITIE